eukprot:TRINITY_DN444_c3_g3_i5.p1 TRINITY_DN444_c3_g3~~TRINITY_DN444_c3_g3_i5.p1  ORF type:complete len:520 (-),score=61.92 TRINITY_DN444_c3_g3_i5:1274-2833(-)
MGLNPQVLATIGMGNNAEQMSQLNFVHGMGHGAVSSMALSLERDNRHMIGTVGNPSLIPGTNQAVQGLHNAMGSGMFGAPGIDGSLMNLNVQNSQGVPSMHASGSNPMYPTHPGQTPSLTSMGLNMMSHAHLDSLSPEKKERAIAAMKRRFDRGQFYGDSAQLRNGIPLAEGAPPNNANSLGPNPVLTADPNGNPSNPAANHAIGGTPATPGSQIDSSILNTRNMINNAASLGSLQPGLSLGAPQTSAAESQTSTRVTGPKSRPNDNDTANAGVIDNRNNSVAGIPNRGLQGNVMGPNVIGVGDHPANKLANSAMGGGVPVNGAGMNVINGNDQVLSTSAVGPQAGSIPPPMGAVTSLTPPATSGRRLWIGDIRMWGTSATHDVRCVAIAETMEGQPPIQDSQSWPKRLDCDHGKMRRIDVNELSGAQWFVRFVAVDEHGDELAQNRVTSELVQLMLQRNFAFEIPCTEQEGTPGSLLLFGMKMRTDLTLIGVFKPAKPDIDNDFMMMMDNVIPVAPKQ